VKGSYKETITELLGVLAVFHGIYDYIKGWGEAGRGQKL
jgi:hypothetical protein